MTTLEFILIVALAVALVYILYLTIDRDGWKDVARRRANDIEDSRCRIDSMLITQFEMGNKLRRKRTRRDLLALCQFRKMQRDIERTIKRIDAEKGESCS